MWYVNVAAGGLKVSMPPSWIVNRCAVVPLDRHPDAAAGISETQWPRPGHPIIDAGIENRAGADEVKYWKSLITDRLSTDCHFP